jgi:hypothetical protein
MGGAEAPPTFRSGVAMPLLSVGEEDSTNIEL